MKPLDLVLKLRQNKAVRLLSTAAFLLVVILLPFSTSAVVTRLLTTSFIYCIVSFGNMFIFGFAGMMCLGFAAFWGTGAYVAAILSTRLGVPFIPCCLAAAVFTALLGALISLPILRLSADFVGLITTAWLNIFLAIVRNWTSLTNGPIGIVGIPRPSIFGWVIDSKNEFYYVMLGFTVLFYVLSKFLIQSRIGRDCMGMRDNELGTIAIGVDTRRLKIFVFTFGTFLAGFAGSLYAFYIGAIAPNNFTFAISAQIMQMCIIGGIGTLPGAVVGTLFMTLFTELWRPLAVYRLGIAGLLLVILMLVRPQGLVGSRAYAGDSGLLDRIRQKTEARRASKQTQTIEH